MEMRIFTFSDGLYTVKKCLTKKLQYLKEFDQPAALIIPLGNHNVDKNSFYRQDQLMTYVVFPKNVFFLVQISYI